MALETIFALSSGRPPAAIAIIRISGGNAHAAAAALAGDLPPARQAAVRQIRAPVSGELLDEALVLRFDGPGSVTGENLVEFHCHGGRAVVEGVLGALEGLDAVRPASPGEFTRRAFQNGRIDLTEAEGLADLLEAETESQRRAALLMAEGGLRKQIEAWQQVLIDLSARAEAAIDYVDEDSVQTDPGLAGDCAALAAQMADWLQRPRAEPLRDGVSVVLAGPPNSGKSSLLNALAGHDRAIVSALPGTTRDHIDVSLALAGVPLRLTDTAGLRDSSDEVEQVGVARSLSLIEVADILVWMGDSDPPAHPRTVRVHSRCDLEHRQDAPADALPVSSVSRAGICELCERIIAHARSLLPLEGQLALNRRQADCISGARQSLAGAAQAPDVTILAEELRTARAAFERLTGRAGLEEVLDRLFARFCLGK